MTVRDFKPSPILSPYIHKYYLMEGNFGKDTYDVFFADGCPEIVFNVGVDFYRNGQKEDWAKAIGQIVEPLHVKANGTGKSFGIWFYPHGLTMFSNVPAKKLTNTAIELEHLFDKNFIDFAGSCLVRNDIEKLITGLNVHFEKTLEKQSFSLKQTTVEIAVTRLSKQYHNESVFDEICSQCNISNRYLQKIFLNRIGLRPKQFQRIIRFQQALGLMVPSTSRNLTAIAHKSGYFDQSHFIRDFKEFTAIVPSRYTPYKHPINQYFLSS